MNEVAKIKTDRQADCKELVTLLADLEPFIHLAFEQMDGEAKLHLGKLESARQDLLESLNR